MSLAAEALQKWSASAEGWIEAQRRGDRNRVFLLNAPMLLEAGDVDGKRVLDVGCGEGRFCRMLAQRGAVVTGLDPTPELLDEARRQDPSGAYRQGIAESLPFEAGAFDLVISYITLVDIPDFRAAIAEMVRVLRPGGQLLIANINPFASTTPRAWYRNEQGEKLHVSVVDYYEERANLLEAGALSLLNWHRPMEQYMEALLGAGLILRRYLEPRPTPEAVEQNPDMLDEYRVPLFHVMRWERP